MNLFLYGIIFAASLVATGFFLTFWKKTKDPLFLLFGLAFALLAIERLVLACLGPVAEYRVYLIRLFAFLLIIIAIVQKNRPKRS